MEKIALVLCNTIITPSKYANLFVQSLIKPFRKNGRIHIIPNIVPEEYFTNITRDEQKRFKEKYNLEAKNKIILYSGRIEIFKGLENLAKAFSLFENANHNARLVFAYPYSSANNQVLRQLKLILQNTSLKKNIYWLPDLTDSDLVKLYNIADLLVLPSEFELAPLSVIEGFAQGLPAIATDVGNCKELLSKIDKDLTLKDNSPEEIYKKLNWFFNLPKLRLKKINKKVEKVAINFTESNAIKALGKLLTI